MRRRIVTLLLASLLLCAAAGCGEKNAADGTENTSAYLRLYCPAELGEKNRSAGGGDAVNGIPISWKQVRGDDRGRQQQAQYIMELLLGGCTDKDFICPVPKGTAVNSCTVTGGTVSQSMMNTALSIGVACAVMLSMVRVLTGISIYWILVPGYALALILARYVPSVFVGIAFDSGGVASGPMTSTFLLPLAMGACTALGGNVVTDAFGVVALVALAPPVAIQIMGVIYVHRAKAVAEDKADLLPDDGVIDLEDEEI